MNGFDMVKNAIDRSGKFDIIMEGEVNNEIGEDEVGIFKKGYGMIFKKKAGVKKIEELKEQVDKEVVEEFSNVLNQSDVSIVGKLEIGKDDDKGSFRIKTGKGIIEIYTPELIDYFKDFEDDDEIEITFRKGM